MGGSIVLRWAAKAELASLFSSCDINSEFVSPMFVLVDLSLTLNLSSGGDKSVLFCSVTAEWKIKDCEQFSKPVVAEIRFRSGLLRPTNCLQSSGRCLSFVENLRMLQRARGSLEKG